MALGDLTKQLAEQAIRNAASRPATASQPDGAGPAIMGQVQAMQKALKEDEELIVLCQAAGETIRVMEFYLPSWQIAVLTGADRERNVARVISPVESLQLVCKVIRTAPAAKASRIRFVTPKSSE